MYIHERHIPLESNIFCGLTSKWTIYFECINSSAWANCLVKFFDSSSVKVFRSPTQYSKISPPIALKIILECQIFFIWLYSVSTGTEIPELWRYDYSIWSHCGAPFFKLNGIQLNDVGMKIKISLFYQIFPELFLISAYFGIYLVYIKTFSF